MTSLVSTDQHVLTTRDPDDPTTFSWLCLLDITRLWQHQISIDQELPDSETTRDVSTSIWHPPLPYLHSTLCTTTLVAVHINRDINRPILSIHLNSQDIRFSNQDVWFMFIIYRIISHWIFVYSSYSSRVCIIYMFWIFEHYDTRFLFTSCKECTRTQSWYHELSISSEIHTSIFVTTFGSLWKK